MNIQLRERELNPIFRHIIVYPFIHVIQDIPVILLLHPSPYDKLDAAVPQCSKSNGRICWSCGGADYPFFSIHDILENGFHLF